MTIDGPVSDYEAIDTAGCPYCHVRKGTPCVYVMPTSTQFTEEELRERAKWSQDTDLLAKVTRVGTPTKTVHADRRNRVRDLRRRAAQLVVLPASPQRREIAAAMVAWDRQEATALRAWFAEYGEILTGQQDPTEEPTK